MASNHLRDLDIVKRGRRRHCFALQGDLRRLAADVYVIPTDEGGRVERHWTWAVDCTVGLPQGQVFVDDVPVGPAVPERVNGGLLPLDESQMNEAGHFEPNCLAASSDAHLNARVLGRHGDNPTAGRTCVCFRHAENASSEADSPIERCPKVQGSHSFEA